MDFLALSKKLRSEAGVAGSGPITVVGQTGELGRLVDWIVESYEDIQDKNPDWYFLRNDFSFNTVIGTAIYARSTVSNPALENWKTDTLRMYETAVGVKEEQRLSYDDWDEFKELRLFGSVESLSGRPTDFTVKPDKSLQVWPKPDKIYTIRGEYYRTAHVMTLNTDTPLFSQYQKAIVFNALMSYATYENEPPLFAYAQKKYNRLINKLELDRAPNAQLGGAMV